MSNLSLALTESRSLRTEKLSELSQDESLKAINKAKALIMAFWQGENICSTSQIADFYEVSEDTVKKCQERHRDEFVSDGLKVLRGKDLRDVRESLSLTSDTSKATVWTPRAALRLGMLLRDSHVARVIRDILLDVGEKAPQQSQEIEKLKLELELIKAKTYYMDRRDAIAQLHGTPMLALLDGRPDAVVEKIEKVTETIVVRDGRSVSFEGKSTAQVGKELGFRTGKEFERWLDKVGHGDLICQGLRVNQTPYIPTENLATIKRVWQENRGKTRQLLIGE